MSESFAVRVGPKGRILVPAPLRRELAMEEGAEVVVRAERGRLVVEPRAVVLGRLRAVVRNAVPPDVSLVDELLAGRKDELRQERRRRRT
jgi:AbrB family looped-hinge helix DNA binding protein